MGRGNRQGSIAAACALLGLWSGVALAADHNEAPGTKDDPSVDIDDVYAWENASGEIVVIVTFGGPGGDPAVAPPEYDPDVLYGIHIDNDADNLPDHDVWVRFGEATDGSWGVQFSGLPGVSGSVEGAVATGIDTGGGKMATVGVFDDPFFFDLTGLQNTLTTGSVSFDSTRDSFAGKNVNAIVLELDAVAASGGNDVVRVWATTGRK